jgi:hypothetical protein
LLITQERASFVACVEEIAAISRGGSSMVNLWCGSAHAESVHEESDGMIRVPKSQRPASVQIIVSPEVSITELSMMDRGDHVEFRYVW